jgi:hypothetical protein
MARNLDARAYDRILLDLNERSDLAVVADRASIEIHEPRHAHIAAEFNVRRNPA